jgi:hypothetical protein
MTGGLVANLFGTYIYIERPVGLLPKFDTCWSEAAFTNEMNPKMAVQPAREIKEDIVLSIFKLPKDCREIFNNVCALDFLRYLNMQIVLNISTVRRPIRGTIFCISIPYLTAALFSS